MRTYLIASLFLYLLSASFAGAENSASSDDINKSNNPLTPAVGLNLQNYYTGSYYGLGDSDANTMLLRSTIPHKLFGQPQILRVTAPMVTSPDEPSESTTGLGDVNVFDIFLTKMFDVEVGIGPQFTLPTATDDKLGTEKWQAGAALAVIDPQAWGLIGGLVTYQHSFAGEEDRATQNAVQAQPFLIYNLANGFYARSSASWNFDAARGDYFIPVGAGGGKVWKLDGGSNINLFLEPQWTLLHEGVAPQFQLFAGLNFQFHLG